MRKLIDVTLAVLSKKTKFSDKSVDINLILKTSRFLVGSGKYEETYFAVLSLRVM